MCIVTRRLCIGRSSGFIFTLAQKCLKATLGTIRFLDVCSKILLDHYTAFCASMYCMLQTTGVEGEHTVT
jgi:hypothetical protein